MTEFPGFLTVQQAADRLGVSRTTIWRRIESGALSAYRSTRNASVRLLDITDVEAIERVTQEKGRKRKDWSGKDWTDLMIEAAANRAPERLPAILDSDIWAEDQAPSPEPTVQAAQPWDDEDED